MTDANAAFQLSEAFDAQIAEAASLLARASRSVALTGAGLSVESGIPPFRGKGGLWTKHGEPPMDGFERFVRDPAAYWRERLEPTTDWMRALAETLGRARPNPGHRALAELERAGAIRCVITQNIDDLHRQGGSKNLLEIHGNFRLLRCIGCGARFGPEELRVDLDSLPPHCPRCGGLVKGDTVHFGEPIPTDVLERCFEEVGAADCMLVAGTSATVHPAAGFPVDVLRRGGSVIEVNPEESELTPLATLFLRGPGGAVLDRLLHHCQRALTGEVPS